MGEATAFSVELGEIRELARRVARERIAPGALERDAKRTFPWDGIRALGEAGLLEVGISESYGGVGGERSAFVSISEEVGSACASTALVYVSSAIAAKAIEVAGTEAIKKKWLPELMAGRSVGAFAVHEPDSGCNSAAITTRAKRDGDHYLVNGSKFFITSAQEADVYVVLTRPDPLQAPAQMTALLMEKDTLGLSFGRPEEKMGLASTSSREMFFTDCRVHADNLLGNEGEGSQVIGKAVAGWGFFGAAAIGVGIAKAATGLSIKHANERLIAGQPIAVHQAVQTMIADMVVATEAAEALLAACVARADASPGAAAIHGFKAKLFASETAVNVADRAIQVHGGHGYCREYMVERLLRDARGLLLHFKTSELLRQDIAGAALRP
ncbi:MAG: acyl-CoA dehydrogenase family protein [Armatimonadota bacterium]